MGDALDRFDPATAGRHDPGHIRVLFDNRTFATFNDKLPWYQSYSLKLLSDMNWTSLYKVDDLDPGMIRLIWYTHVGNQGSRDFPLYKATAVKEMFDSLSEEGFRPLVIGWSAENPFPMIGGIEPPAPPKKKEPKRAKTWSNAVSGHSGEGTPHDRVMKIIEHEEEIEAAQRRDDVLTGDEKDGLLRV